MKSLLPFFISLFILSPVFALNNSNTVSIYELINSNDAKQILDRVSQKYKSLESVKVDFSLQIINPDAGIDETQIGELYVKGDKYRIETEELERMSDTESVWTHFKSEEEVQVNTFDPEEGEISPAQIFTIYEEQEFQYVVKETVGNKTTIDLLPSLEEKMPYHRIRITVNTDTNLIEKATIFEKNGTRFIYSLDNFKSNVRIDDNYFFFNSDKNPNIDVIDLR